jgi:hypothetical protein
MRYLAGFMQERIALFQGGTGKKETALLLVVIDIGFNGRYVTRHYLSHNSLGTQGCQAKQ